MPATRQQSSAPKRGARSAAPSAAHSRPARQRNPRGQGERLRDDIIEAAGRLLADPTSPPLTLRAVAREVGVAATSVYLHFDDVESLILAVAERRFGELVKLQDEARDVGATACERVRAGCIAYCQFGITYQGHYQVMFARPLPMPESMPPEQFPGYPAFQQLIDAVSECIGRESQDPESFRTAMLIWQQLHGTVSLRISRPRFPWPPLEETVADVVDRILAAVAAAPRST